jgi:hypothetical protein
MASAAPVCVLLGFAIFGVCKGAAGEVLYNSSRRSGEIADQMVVHWQKVAKWC